MIECHHVPLKDPLNPKYLLRSCKVAFKSVSTFRLTDIVHQLMLYNQSDGISPHFSHFSLTFFHIPDLSLIPLLKSEPFKGISVSNEMSFKALFSINDIVNPFMQNHCYFYRLHKSYDVFALNPSSLAIRTVVT